MTDKEKITTSKITEEQERLKAKYEADINEAKQKILNLENKIIKQDDEIFELQKDNQREREEKEDWKKEAHASRRVEREKKETKEKTSFLEKFNLLQQQKT